jgi:hypothetical protein
MTHLSRDLAAAIKNRYDSLRRFHETCAPKVSYYLLRRAVAGEPCRDETVQAIEAAADGLLVPEATRGRVPDNYEALKMYGRQLALASRNLLQGPITFDSLVALGRACDNLERILK